MYSKEEASRLREEFWTALGQYLRPVLSSEGQRVNWLNYKTGLKHVYFRMQADARKAWIAIEIAHPDTGIQELFYEQFLKLKNMLHSTLNEQWNWALHTTDDNGRTISRIYTEISPVNIFSKDHWPALISFFKPRIIALDEFWSMAKDAFEPLKN